MAIENLARKLKALSRPCWVPVSAQLEDHDLLASKYGGTPYTSEQWPRPDCAFCHEPQTLLLQLRLEQLPVVLEPAIASPTLLQLFFCTNDDAECYSETYG